MSGAPRTAEDLTTVIRQATAQWARRHNAEAPLPDFAAYLADNVQHRVIAPTFADCRTYIAELEADNAVLADETARLGEALKAQTLAAEGAITELEQSRQTPELDERKRA
ncbi:hypothetical protein SAMN04489729_4834 [Amycolatopsis lurida]|uniref:KfrA N-terminal DNA-binding domain-containing protein n=1 Tax=Amycolatopsis lurida NRRL 2430 TaxID=1460371 RepID=A0A2P2FWA4_AMYLU|nr:hypothetical protein [Amycolatopsis lurida]KFU80994.1 hypothetical protein BB31_11465 [Amycolatopsis lurida NRRL 2430]SED61322.1 hypothetical protein SAMN04489729_4834 [Amycolatopsis lurida]